jgi:hypothetical protein
MHTCLLSEYSRNLPTRTVTQPAQRVHRFHPRPPSRLPSLREEAFTSLRNWEASHGVACGARPGAPWHSEKGPRCGVPRAAATCACRRTCLSGSRPTKASGAGRARTGSNRSRRCATSSQRLCRSLPQPEMVVGRCCSLKGQCVGYSVLDFRAVRIGSLVLNVLLSPTLRQGIATCAPTKGSSFLFQG